MRRGHLAVVVLASTLTAALFAGCGSSSPGISEDASRQLELHVAAVRNAAAARDRGGAVVALANMRQAVTDLRARDKITADRAAKVREAAAVVEAQLQSIPTTTTSTTTTLPPTTREEKNNRKDKRGRDGGGGGD